eukprot:COSAG01_NODE_1672_length_9554_cov_4.065785_3_plen_86_part_00
MGVRRLGGRGGGPPISRTRPRLLWVLYPPWIGPGTQGSKEPFANNMVCPTPATAPHSASLNTAVEEDHPASITMPAFFNVQRRSF